MGITTVVAVAAGVAAGATVAGAVISSEGQQEAAETQAEATAVAGQQQYAQYLQTRADQAPWRIAGTEAVNKLTGLVEAGPGKYEESPYYDWLMGEGTKARERAASAKGMLASGAEQKALTEYGQNLASTDYGNWLDRWYRSLTPWQSLAGLGQTSVQQTGQLGQQTANQMGQYTMAGGQAQAAGQLGVANTWSNKLDWLAKQAGNYAMDQYENQLNQPYNYPSYPATYGSSYPSDDYNYYGF